MNCQHSIRDDMAWYVNGTLPAEERSAVELHLQSCADCARFASTLQILSNGLAERALAMSPPAVENLLVRLPVPQPRPQFNWRWVLALTHTQARVVRGEIWPVSALVMMIGLVITLLAADVLPLVLMAPLVAAVGAAFIYGPAVDPALEIELATPTSPRLVLLVRLALVFGYNTVFGVLGSVLFALLHSEVMLWPIVISWLVPMIFLSSLALLLTVLSADPGLGALFSLVLWVLLNLSRSDGLTPFLFSIPDVLAASARPWLFLMSVLMSMLALAISGRDERWLGRAT